MSESRTVWLVGMMGAGKSTVGPGLARRLGWRFVDSDAEIERTAGCSVAEIFEREGEAAFRARERAAIARWSGHPAVVALGGGALAQPGAREQLSRTGTLVYLRARLDTLLSRIGDASERPLLRGLERESRKRRLEALLASRRQAYESAAVVIDTDAATPEAVAARLADRLRWEARA